MNLLNPVRCFLVAVAAVQLLMLPAKVQAQSAGSTTPPIAPAANAQNSPTPAVQLASTPVPAKKSGNKDKHGLLAARSTPPETALKTYIERVRAHSAEETLTPGSLWSDSGALVRLSTDVKAVHLYDVVQIVVSESLAASTDGAVKNSRASSASASITALFGALKSSNALQNLLGQTGASALTAQGQSTTNSSLVTSFGGEVVDVLPNGMLVVEAVRQLTFSQQTQLIKLRGLVRPEDVDKSNQVQSSAMTDLELEVTGKGIINDTTYRQNPLVRFLEKLVVF